MQTSHAFALILSDSESMQLSKYSRLLENMQLSRESDSCFLEPNPLQQIQMIRRKITMTPNKFDGEKLFLSRGRCKHSLVLSSGMQWGGMFAGIRSKRGPGCGLWPSNLQPTKWQRYSEIAEANHQLLRFLHFIMHTQTPSCLFLKLKH